MNLRLYKTPYYDPIYPNVRRLLFEGKVPADDQGNESDLYIYVWLNMDGYLHAFQAVLGDMITLALQMPDRLSFGKLSRDIVNRASTQRETSDERKMIVSAIDQITNESFPSLLESIKRIIGGESILEVQLAQDEMTLFVELCGEI